LEIDFLWGISLERGLQTILEVVGIFDARERAIVAIR